MITAVALDDEPIAIDIIRHFVEKVPFMSLKAEFTDPFEALEYMQKEPVDLLFIDINMPDILGIDFVTLLQKKPMVVFTTGYAEFAVKSFELDAIDYLLKPFTLARFLKACNKVRDHHDRRGTNKENDFLFIKTGYDLKKILLDDICYLEAAGNYIDFVLSDRVITSRMTFSELNTLLPENKFIKVHRCFTVAINKIDRIERHQVHIGDKKIPVSESYMQNVMSMHRAS